LKPVRLPLRAGTALFSDSYATIDSLLPVLVYHNFRKGVQKWGKIPQKFKDSIQKNTSHLSFDAVTPRLVRPTFRFGRTDKIHSPALSPRALSASRFEGFCDSPLVTKSLF